MKKLVFASLLLTAFVLGANETKATTVSSNNKSQVESSSKPGEGSKYNFTLFSFFNYSQQIKADSTATEHTIHPALKEKEQKQ